MAIRIFAIALLLLISSWDAQAQTIRYIHTDGLGSIVLVTDASRNVVERREYEPYGAVLTGIKDGPSYAGYVTDAQTGLSYMQQRYYDPFIGRMLSVDPVTAYSSGDMRHFNTYGYAYNNPYKFTDPDGRCPACPIIIGGFVGGITDYAVQKYFNPDKPVNKIELGISIAAGAVSGGTGGALVGAVARGTASVGEAVAVQALVNGAVGASSVAVQGTIEGTPVTESQVITGGFSNAFGGLVASGIGVAAGDFSAAAAKGSLQRMWGSTAPGLPNIAGATMSTGKAIPTQSGAQALGSQAAQGAVQGVVEIKKRELENR